MGPKENKQRVNNRIYVSILLQEHFCKSFVKISAMDCLVVSANFNFLHYKSMGNLSCNQTKKMIFIKKQQKTYSLISIENMISASIFLPFGFHGNQ